MVILRSLHNGLRRREAPEEVAVKIIELLDLDGAQAVIFPKRSPWYSRYGTSMRDEWEHPVPINKPLRTLGVLTATQPPPGDKPAAVRDYLATIRPLVGMIAGHTSFKHDRADRDGRRLAGIGHLSRRRYDKLFRLVGRIERYADELDDQIALARLGRFAKIGLAADVPYAAFAHSANTAAFIAYHTANLGRRSLFLAGPQARAFDSAAKMLMERCETDSQTDWFAIAHTFPRDDVLARLTLDQRAVLLDAAREVLDETAHRLKALADRSGTGMNLAEMIVRRGNDSSTWNALAGAWNKARDLWIATAWSLDPSLTDAFLPGKVLRLMAADVAFWHRSVGGGLDPDTRVWARLPRPWAVFDGTAVCGRREVIAACEVEKVDPAKSGWAKPRPRTTIAAVQATPESVHGVIVGHPALAELLRKAGWFSAKAVKDLPYGVLPPEVQRDEYGFAVGVRTD